jgi:hypothetical protein
MTTKQQRTQRLIGIFNASQGLDDFRLIVRSLKTNNIRLTHIYNRNAGPAHFDSAARAIQVNMAYSDEAIRIALDHEGTHATQHLLQGRRANTANINSFIGLHLLGEAHAYTSQSEFAVKRYLNALSEGKAEGSIAEKAFDGFFKKNGVAGRDYLKAFLKGLTGIESISLKQPSDVTSALHFYHFNHAQRVDALPPRIIKGRKAAIQEFFSVEMFKNNPVMDEYIQSYIQHLTKYKTEYSRRDHQLSLNEMLSSHQTNNEPFLSEKQLQDALNIKNTNDLIGKVIAFSAHKAKYTALMQETNLSSTLRKGFGFNSPFNL